MTVYQEKCFIRPNVHCSDDCMLFGNGGCVVAEALGNDGTSEVSICESLASIDSTLKESLPTIAKALSVMTSADK